MSPSHSRRSAMNAATVLVLLSSLQLLRLSDGSVVHTCHLRHDLVDVENQCVAEGPRWIEGTDAAARPPSSADPCLDVVDGKMHVWPQPQKLDVEYLNVEHAGMESRALRLDSLKVAWEDDPGFDTMIVFDRLCARMIKMMVKRADGCSGLEAGGANNVEVVVRSEEEERCQGVAEGYYRLRVERAGASIMEQVRVVVDACGRSGVQYAFETLTQVIPQVGALMKRVSIEDWPRFGWRGLMMDTSRHFITVDDVLMTLSAMAFNKMNVLHLHLTDAASFPLYFESLPQLFNGWSERQRYTKEDLKRIVNAASELSIEVIPEIDMPQHTRSWKGIPGIVLECPSVKPRDPNDYDDSFKKMDIAVLNISSPTTLEVVRLLLEELADVFPSEKIHIGFDEVDYRCWDAYPAFRKWKRNNRLSNRAALRQFFLNVSKEVVSRNKTWIVWQDAIEMLDYLPEGGIIQAWKCWKEAWTQDELLGRFVGRLASRHMHTIVESTCLYLDYESEWTDLYKRTPPTYAVGGEACLWSEKIDFTNLHCRLWPRTSAVAERLWNPDVSQSFAKVNERLVTFSRLLEKAEGIQVTRFNDVGFSKTESGCPLLPSQSIQRDPFSKNVL